MRASAYVICATPRSGSTLLCDLLATSGVAGRPHSYFRAEDIDEWADGWGVEGQADLQDPAFDRAYVCAMAKAGRAGTDVFGLRLMPASLKDATRRLGTALGQEGDLPTLLGRAFGPTRYIHLSRDDRAAQAASLLRAQQSGLWHVSPDGSERERTAPMRAAPIDAEALAVAQKGLAADDRAWERFFAAHAIAPLRLTYERLAADPHAELATVLAALGLDPTHAANARIMTRKMASGANP
ncbi:LPS sulfotransferase NodH [Aureimonas jatrophae]|uniref:LPS sulfotransferase NodH n=2 Tax=Aureimonas jatrophae TaxID=1166073 RepID=A0A1H0DJD7_9HYPH|nr:LPS sulfotransferase NodH [Aureimonas jatrophae]